MFKSGLSKRLHEARFLWMAEKIREFDIPYKKVFELGCFDAKTIDFMPSHPDYYVGYDANWHDCLTVARAKWKDFPQYKFYQSDNPAQINEPENSFDLAISMETLEHVVPFSFEEEYIKKLHSLTNNYLIVTVPNEIGLLFLLKRSFKYLFLRRNKDMQPFTSKEIFYATLGRTDKVNRDDHKGFNYKNTIALIQQHFEIKKVQGIQFRHLPLSFNFTIGIVAKKK